MKIAVETHCHTIASGHAYSTVKEIVEEAKKKGIKGVALTDHGPAMVGASNIYQIINQRVIPKEIDGIMVLKGVEANIVDHFGKLDIENNSLEKLDLIIASLHNICIHSKSEKENTNALIKAMENPVVDIIGHSGNPYYPIKKEIFVKKAKETNTLVEINNSSFLASREGSKENCIEIMRLCKKHDVKIVMGSDAHIAYDIGRNDKSKTILEDLDFDTNLIVNLSIEKMKKHLKDKGKTI